MERPLCFQAQLRSKIYDKMYEWGQLGAPDEVCGLWQTDKHQQTHLLYLFQNTAIKCRSSFRIHPDHLKAFVEEHHIGEQSFYEQFKVWHTHPSGLVGPSKGDVDVAQLKVKYVVMTIPTREVVMYERCQ